MRSCRPAKLKWAYESFTGAISSTAKPTVLQTFFFMRRYSLPNFDLAGKESLRYKNHSMRIMKWQDKVDPPTVCLQISGCTARESVVNYLIASSGGAAAEAIDRKGRTYYENCNSLREWRSDAAFRPCHGVYRLHHRGYKKKKKEALIFLIMTIFN